MAAALRTGNDRMAVRARNGLVSVVGDRQARFDEGRAWFDMAYWRGLVTMPGHLGTRFIA